MLGAPEMVFGDAASDPAGELGRTVTELASTGRRTLVLAHSAVALTDADVEAERLPDGVAPVIVLTFREQVRPDAAHTLAYFATQGVGIRIISGDNPRTVAAIAREVGLDVAEGYDARKLPEDDAELGEILETHRVFGRVTPEQKKRMVVALQARGHTRRDDRRRRQRRARDQDRRHRHRDELRRRPRRRRSRGSCCSTGSSRTCPMSSPRAGR